MWPDEERELLVQLTQQYTNAKKQIQWRLVAEQFPSRTQYQVKAFFTNILKPQLDARDYKQNQAWDVKDDAALCELVLQFLQLKKKWKMISKVMTKYSPSQLKLRYFYLNKKGMLSAEQIEKTKSILQEKQKAQEDQQRWSKKIEIIKDLLK